MSGFPPASPSHAVGNSYKTDSWLRWPSGLLLALGSTNNKKWKDEAGVRNGTKTWISTQRSGAATETAPPNWLVLSGKGRCEVRTLDIIHTSTS